MNRILPPNHNDAQTIHDLSGNPQLGSHPHLVSAVPLLLAGYAQYELVQGNAFLVSSVSLTNDQGMYLKGHYSSPPDGLEYINKLRDEAEPLPCPMCGSMHAGTIDHIFPQVDYPEFAVFSKNLVPACKCNSKRQNTLIGTATGERILHPYYDACLSKRLISVRIIDFVPIPVISLRLEIAQNDPDYAAIAFHVEMIVKRTAICGYLEKRWASMCRKPSLVIRDLGKRNPSTEDELKLILEKELDLLDELHGGKNNWNSVFIAGLLDGGTLTSFFQHLTRPGRLVDEPLFP